MKKKEKKFVRVPSFQDIMDNIRENISALPATNGYCTLGEYAKAIGMNPSTLHRIVNGDRIPDLLTLKKIADLAGIKLSTLLDLDSIRA